MQSMECYSPWYECSECGKLYHKLPEGAERASWCDHLRAAGHPDDTMRASSSGPSSNASRILGDVCFTGTGLIFGSRGARGAYSEAHLESWEDEVASFHHTAHAVTSSPPSTASRSEIAMGVVQIEQSELDLLRKERDDARSEAATAKQEAETAKSEKAESDRKVEEAEAAVTKAETEKAAAVKAKTDLEEQANQSTLRDKRWGELGEGFVAKLGETTKGRLKEQAASMSDDDWDNRLKEVEELTAVKRDATKDGSPAPADEQAGDRKDLFSLEEIASAGGTLTGGGSGAPTDAQRSSVVGNLSKAFAK
jgi:hypothetical protein